MGTMRKKQQSHSLEMALPGPSNNSFIASAARVQSNIRPQGNSQRDRQWQEEAYRLYKQVGEFRYACDWVGSMMSKARLFPTLRKSAGIADPITEGLPREYMDDLFGNPDGRSEMLRLIGIHMSIAGECYLVGYDNPDPMADERQMWQVVSPLAISRQGGMTGKWMINNEVLDLEPQNVMVIRLWRADPVDGRFAMAPTRALLNVLNEILRLTQHVAAQVDSRLAGAGILLMPSEMTFPPPPEAEGPQLPNASVHHTNDAESLMKTITDAMGTSINNRDSASALVPIVITAPADAIKAVQHVTFWSELDRQAIELRNEAIRRLALGMDMPPEILQGTSDANHWSAWQADESAIKAHTEPLLKIITSGIAQGYLRPMLKAGDSAVMDADLRDYSVAADTSEMRLRPNRSKEAFELFDRGEISGSTLRRETGFTDEDAMTDKELAAWYTRKVASGSTTPDLVAGALQAIGVNVSPAATTDGETQDARPTPSLKDHEERGLPDAERNAQIQESRKEKQGAPTGSLVASSPNAFANLQADLEKSLEAQHESV